jgi:hypothetical protein
VRGGMNVKIVASNYHCIPWHILDLGKSPWLIAKRRFTVSTDVRKGSIFVKKTSY